MSFHELGLAPDLIRALEACKFTTPTEIQQQAIPLALDGRDLMASAQTGSGKTAAFVLPILQRLAELKKEQRESGRQEPQHDNRDRRGGRNGRGRGRGEGPLALILTPTRELATQICDVIAELGRFARPRFGAVVGGVSYNPQERLLNNPLDILVATPGRLIDHMQQGKARFNRLEIMVLDEADRMLDMGFIKPVEQILAATPDNRQTLLFSATLEGDIARVTKRHLNDPARIQLAHSKQRHEDITQFMHVADGLKHKKAVLAHLLDNPELSQAVVFTATKWRAKSLAEELGNAGHPCTPLHGDMTQAARRKAVDRLREGKVRILVATDVAARGLDVPGITHVINFELPTTPEDYIHRIGRTGRAGATGTAVSLVAHADGKKLSQIERLTGAAIERRPLPDNLAPLPDVGRTDGKPRSHGARKQGDRDRPGGGAARKNNWRKRRDDSRSGGPRSGGQRSGGGQRPGGQRSSRQG